MTRITAVSQLSILSVIQDIVQSDSVLLTKFPDNKIVQFDPQWKASSFPGFPYLWAPIPSSEDTTEYLGDTLQYREFEIPMVLTMEWDARDNYANYAGRLLTIMNASRATWNALGYQLVSFDADGPPSQESIHQKEVLRGEFTLVLQGDVPV